MSGNVCIRCGKDRVLQKKWQEEVPTFIGVSVVTRSLYVCPDTDCQEKVNVSLEEKRQISLERKRQVAIRAEQRLQSRVKLAAAKQSL